MMALHYCICLKHQPTDAKAEACLILSSLLVPYRTFALCSQRVSAVYGAHTNIYTNATTCKTMIHTTVVNAIPLRRKTRPEIGAILFYSCIDLLLWSEPPFVVARLVSSLPPWLAKFSNSVWHTSLLFVSSAYSNYVLLEECV